jgi:hypothetical protein
VRRRRSMRQISRIAAVIVWSVLVSSAGLALAETSLVERRETLTRALQGAWLPLESGLVVSAREGVPLSAKYEIDDGTFQLSVYTSANGSSSGEAFTEVIVDYSAGIVLKTTTISNDGDLAAARAQKEALDRAKRSLAEATTNAVKANAGYRAVSATPRLDNGRPVAEIALVRGDEWKVVSEFLD